MHLSQQLSYCNLQSMYTVTEYTISLCEEPTLCNVVCGMAVDAPFLEYNSPWSQLNSLQSVATSITTGHGS